MASVTVWTRLEPHPRDGSLARSLAAQVRDPLWFLARQAQIGEFHGEDAGSPVQATMSVAERPLTGYAPGTGGPVTGYDPALPVEVHVERVPVTLNVRGAARLGRWAEAAIRAAVPAATADTAIAELRAAYPIAATAPPDAAEDPAGRAVRASLAGRVVDGVALAAAAAVAAGGGTPVPPLPPAATVPGVADALAGLVAYRAALYSEPGGDPAWVARRLGYAATLTSTTSTDTVTLAAADFPGGDLDWYSFGAAPAGTTAPALPGQPAEPVATGTVRTVNFLPTHVTFRGMPAPRWWQFEDAATDFGAVRPDQVDLPTLLLMEFALVFGNDWFVVPVPTGVGSLSRITTLVVTDTFGVRTAVQPAGTARPAAGGTAATGAPAGTAGPAAAGGTAGTAPAARWSMFTTGDLPYLFLPPVCGVVADGEPIEDVRFLRDDMAAMSWAVQHTVQGPLDAPIDAVHLAVAHDAAYPPPPLPARVPGGPAQAYLLENLPPDNWIPMVPVVAPSGARYFRRGVIARPGRGDVAPAARLLEPGRPLFVADEAIPREGTQVTRYFRRTRWLGGSTVTWLAHHGRPGLGPGWSGLAFDLVVPLPPGTG